MHQVSLLCVTEAVAMTSAPVIAPAHRVCAGRDQRPAADQGPVGRGPEQTSVDSEAVHGSR